MKRWIWRMLWALVVLGLLAAAFDGAGQVAQLCSPVSLPFEETLAPEQLDFLRQSFGEELGATLTFWSQRTEQAATDYGSGSAIAVVFDGDPHEALPVTYILGHGPVEENSCSLSTGLAWALWGSQEVLGLELTLGSQILTVCGVFEEEQALVLYPGTGPLQAAEVAGLPTGLDSYGLSLDLARRSGLGEPTQVLWGSGICAVAKTLPWLAVALCFLRLLLWAGKQTIRMGAIQRNILGFSLAIGLALVLPLWITRIPAWCIPTRWSDFAFWGRLWSSLEDRLLAWLSVAPAWRDVAVKLALGKTALASLGAAWIVSWYPRVTDRP